MSAFPGRPQALCAIYQVVDEAAMPALPGLQRYIEAQPSVGVDRWCAIAVGSADNHLSDKILVEIRDAQHLPLGRPRRGDAPTPHNVIALYFEDIGKVGADCDLEIEAHGSLAVVGDLDILVKAAVDMASNYQAQRARDDWPILAHELTVCQEDARGVVGDGAAV